MLENALLTLQIVTFVTDPPPRTPPDLWRFKPNTLGPKLQVPLSGFLLLRRKNAGNCGLEFWLEPSGYRLPPTKKEKKLV